MIFVKHQDESALNIHGSPPSWIHFTPLSTLSPSVLSQNLTLVVLLRVSILCHSFILHMLMYVFQCYFLNTYHCHLLPLSPEVFSLYLCLICCPACGLINLLKFHTYVLILSIFFLCFLFQTLFCIRNSKFIYLIGTESNGFLFLQLSNMSTVYIYHNVLIIHILIHI